MQSIQSFFWFVTIIIVVFLRTMNAVDSNSFQETRIIVPGAYIVEFSSSLTRIRTSNHHELFYRKMASVKTGVTPYLNFSSHLFIGASFHLKNNDDISAIASLDSVSAIWPVTIYPRPNPKVENLINFFEHFSETENQTYENTFAPHRMTGVDKLHDLGYNGKNISIAIIDSGVDYNHPALGGGFGDGYKIQYGYDFVGDDYTGYNLGVRDEDPLDCNGHGTHVSGIIGANAPLFMGVAPNATLGMYRVFGCGGGAANDVVMAAFIAAFEAGADIITASLGSASAWAEDPLAVVVNRIARTGVSCTLAAGNNGNDGLFFVSSPASGIDVIAVGSVNSIDVYGYMHQGYFTVNSSVNSTFEYFPTENPFPTNISGYSLYALSFNTSNPADACAELPSNSTNLSGKIILIRRGTCTFVNKLQNVQKLGAQYVIFYTNENPITNPSSIDGVLAAMVSAEQGAEWISYLQEGHTVIIDFPINSTETIVSLPNTNTGGKMSTFSSWSPTNELRVKPEVSAPGGYILSTYPLNLGGYAVLSGTSMATPYIAGVIALYKNAKGFRNININSSIIKQMLATTATPLSFSDGLNTSPFLAPVIQQGGGLVNAFAVVHYTTIISPNTLTFNDSTHINTPVEFTISNTNSEAVSYTLTHQAAATAYTLRMNTTFPQSFPPELNTKYATAIISPFNLIIPGSSTAVIRVTLSLPSTLDTQRIPVFSGYINIQSSNNESFHLPYIAVGCNMKNVTVTDFEKFSPYISNSTDNDPIPKPVEANQTFNTSTGLPNFNWRLVMGSPLVRLDILGNGNQTLVAGVNILGSILDYPLYWIARNYLTNDENHYNTTWNGTLSTGIQVPAGNYRFLYRALKIFGDPNNNSDYENWMSPMFTIVYGASLNNSSNVINSNKAQIALNYNIKLSFFLLIISIFA